MNDDGFDWNKAPSRGTLRGLGLVVAIPGLLLAWAATAIGFSDAYAPEMAWLLGLLAACLLVLGWRIATDKPRASSPRAVRRFGWALMGIGSLMALAVLFGHATDLHSRVLGISAAIAMLGVGRQASTYR